MISQESQQYKPFNDHISAIDEAVFLTENTGVSHRIESSKGYLWVIPDNDQPIGKLIERIHAPNQPLQTERL